MAQNLKGRVALITGSTTGLGFGIAKVLGLGGAKVVMNYANDSERGERAFAEAGISRGDVDHLMIYDAFAHVPLYGLEDLGFCDPGEAAAYIRERHTAPGGKLPLNTNGGGLSYMHSGMYGMYAMQESIRQIRGIAPAQVPDAKISVAHGVGGMFSVAGTIIFGSEVPTG